MRSTFQPKTFGLLGGSRARESPLWRTYPEDVADALRGLADLSPQLSFSTFGGGELLFPRTAGRTSGTASAPLRVGLFGGFEAEDLRAVARLGRFPLDLLAGDGLLGLGIEARAYPVANPLAFTDPDRALSGWALRSQLWRGTRRADAYYLERELGIHEFHVLFLVTADPSEPANVSASRPLFLDEVVAPVLDRLRSHEIAAAPWEESHSLAETADLAPAPLQLRINYPLGADPEGRNLARLAIELLREYRAFLSFQENL
jgi:hypothetical protein